MSTITLPNIRVSSDLTIRLKLKDGGVAIDWSTLQNIRVSLYADDQRSMASRCNVSIDEEDSTILVCQYAANKMQYLGVNRVIVQCKYMGEVKTYDKPAFNFVRWTSDQEGEQITIDDPDVDVEISVEDVSSSILQEAVDAAFEAADRANDAAEAAEHMVDIHTGPEGKSAYEVAVEEGYTGTEEEWLASLKGPVGETPDISIGTVTTVEPGTPAAASMSGTPEAPVLNLSIPKGLVGATPNFTVGTVTTGEPGSSVIVTITGTPEAPVLNLTIPQGMQGNTGSSVDYPYELVNNLTTDDATKGLSAAQGKVLDGKVSQLEAKVDEKWKFPDTEITGFVDGAYSTNGSYSTNILNKAGAKGKNLEVQPGQKYKIYGTSDSSTWYRCCAVFKSDGTKILTAPAGNYTTTPYEVTIPSDGAKMTINLINYNSATDKALLVGDVVDAKLLQGEIDDTNAEVNAVDTINQFQEENRQASDIYSPILIDWMQMCHYPNYMESLAYMSVVSSTEDSITLTQAEAETFYSGKITPAVVGFLDGSYKVVYFNGYSGSGDVITRADIDDTDLTNAKTIQSLHDTIRGGSGIHLTPSGYLALGQFTAEELVKRESQKNENLISGANFFYCTEVALGLTKKNIVDSYGRIVFVAESSYGDNSVASGMPGGSLQVFGINGSVITAYAADNGGWLNKCYRMACIGNSQWNKLTFKARGRGFMEFQATLTEYTTTPSYSGTADAEIIVDGVTVQTITLKYSQTRYRINGITAKEKIEIKIKNTSANPTYVLVYSFNFWRMTERVDVPPLSGKKIAVLGDSWTQFPNPQTALSDHESFNNDVVMPNGEVHTGSYGYFPKELARVTGATVDNWGKSNMRADNWGIPMIDELLAYTNYDYVLVEYFINDGNAGIPLKDWASNIKKICQRIIANGARPIVILPCRMNGTTAYGDYHEYLMRGLMNLP